MNKNGEIIIVDDDGDDSDLICDTFKELKITNKTVCFVNATDAIEYLRKIDSDPFYIICDFRMPRINGLEFKQMIYADENLMAKAVPFVLFSSTINSQTFNMALTVGVQGFFLKPATYAELKGKLQTIHTYMIDCFGN